MNNTRFIFLFCILLLLVLKVHAGSIRGRVTDKETGEELVGSSFLVKETGKGFTSGLDGTFILRDIPAGTYTIRCSFISYQALEKTVIVANDQAMVIVDFQLEPALTRLDEVYVVGKAERRSELSARTSERNALTVMNVVSARAIEISPDLDVASVVQRISGVTLERNSSGDAQYAIMRGMDKRYNYTLVNGVKIPSPHNKHRFVPLNMFPSELVDRIEVTKSLTANMEGDATGGVINIEMKDAPATFVFQANGALGYNSYYLDREHVSYPKNQIISKAPKHIHGPGYEASMADFNNQWGKISSRKAIPGGVAGLTIGNRFFKNKLGLILAGNYLNQYKGSTSTFYDDLFSQQENLVKITKLRERTYDEQQQQLGAHLKADFRLGAMHKIEWYNALMKMNNYQVRQSTSTNFALNYNPELGNYDLSYQTRIRTNKQEIMVSNLRGEHHFQGDIKIDWSAVYSYAEHDEPEKSYFYLDQLLLGGVGDVYPDQDGSTREWAKNGDKDLAFYLNTSKKVQMSLSVLHLQAGGLYRDKTRENRMVEYRFKPDGDLLKGRDFNELHEIRWYVHTSKGSVGVLEYDADERIAAGYLQSRLTRGVGTYSVGLRAEHTRQGYFMFFPGPEHEPRGEQVYLDLLPSFSIKLSPGEQVNWRLSYFKSINRPGFFEIVPYLQIEEDYLEFGNKNLKRATIHNLDARWEFFPKPTEQVMIGLFYKQLHNPIEMSYTTVNRRQFGYGPENLGDATNLGIEFDVIKYLRNFGIKANYTYTLSRITTPKAYYGQDANESYTLLFRDQTRPLAGQSPHVANLSFLYMNTRHGWDAQIAAAYTSDKIIIASRFLDSDYWQSSLLQFDASFEKQFKKGLSLFGKINNLLDTPLYHYLKNPNEYNTSLPGQDKKPGSTLIREDRYGRSFLLGLRVKFQ